MKRVIVDYKNVNNDVLAILKETYPNGYDEDDTIKFNTADGTKVEALEVKTEDAIYLVKVSAKLEKEIDNFDIEEYYDEEEDAADEADDDDIDEFDD